MYDKMVDDQGSVHVASVCVGPNTAGIRDADTGREYDDSGGSTSPAILHITSKECNMLITFTTDAYADITMFGDVALKLISMMGHSETVPGALRPEDVPIALEKLRAAVEAGVPEPSINAKDEDKLHVSMTHRALPLIKLLSAAAEQDAYVSWK
jgi:hypothetical protein